jgi:SAM-dependent methyltransferase
VSTERPDLYTKLRRIKYSIASTGLRRGLADTATLLLAYHPDRDHSFDEPFGTDTAGSVQPAQLGIEDSGVREQAILYLPSPARITRWMFDNIGIDHRTFSFVDLGCGKGRVLLVASEYPFQRVIGVEISPQLSAIARQNAARFQPASRRCGNVEVHTGDATTFEFPKTPLLVHLYHPFEPSITEAVLSQLQQSVTDTPRPVAIAYLLYTAALEPVQAVFARFPWLKLRRYEQSVLGQYNWLFYSNSAR